MSYFTRRSMNEIMETPTAQNPSQSEPQYRNFVKSFTPKASPEVAATNSPPTNTQEIVPPQSPVGQQAPVQQASAQEMQPQVAQQTPVEKGQPAKSTIKQEILEDIAEVEKLKNEHFQKWREARKRAGLLKVNKKLKKKRLNAKLEKVLKPKNAFLIFNELNLKPEYIIEETNLGAGLPRTYKASLLLDGHVYSGEGVNIAGAKMVAADVALKDWFSRYLRKSAAAPMKMETREEEEKDETADDLEPAPWSAVGSYAMHLLFARWQMDTNAVAPQTEVHIENIETNNAAGIKSNVTKSASFLVNEIKDYTATMPLKFPPNPEQSQPLYVFNLVFPSVPFVEKVDDTNIEERFTLQCKINGVIYDAKARGKKECKRKLAIKVLKDFGLNFVQNTEVPIAAVQPQNWTPMNAQS